MDSIFRTRSLGTAAEGVRDQYADGRAAKVWEVFIGDKNQRTQNYRDFLVGMLRDKGCKKILDVACGTGVDSVMLLEEGFEVLSVDASDKMLKYALKARWERRKEEAFDNWEIEEANWLTLPKDIRHLIGDGFDAVICLGNSFAHMPDTFGDQREQRQALLNFEHCVKPGGLLLIDHRNYDDIIDTGNVPAKCIYYNSQRTTNIKSSVLFVSGKPAIVTLDYMITLDEGEEEEEQVSEFRLSYYPHRLNVFKDMLDEAFHYRAKHTIYGDFKPLEEIKNPGFYIHVMEKPEYANLIKS
ncbi:glycine N-methyltransferase [Bombus vancouverensis nearcticus]|uniref:Glycine N-methyltransferase n=2 Tax=Pyrobombus TaxID=144703 RepID=A0A6P8N4H7_9HYME|nr:glycine N-methyltransferase [Bombus impatiens]XP_033189659.1 glycine N-methyltransferase [Bombus vancouverensis nearcticus]XP_033315439.1 glycine N-methyltransferase [Bombus bifarius]XP_050469745.1 glycine N-methyltransferase [Bombus huntii]XP_050469746.1 glycine N-methyltransferase [Bombus huntii]XP_050469747.1 glycine N-methyltransferase [Bombus huntii]